jgi:hypothetical protein
MEKSEMLVEDDIEVKDIDQNMSIIIQNNF